MSALRFCLTSVAAALIAPSLLTGCGGGSSGGENPGKPLPNFLQRQGGDGDFAETPDPSGCSVDAFEQNDSPAAAKVIANDTSLALNFCDDAEDYFRISLAGGETLTLYTASLEVQVDTVITLQDSAGSVLAVDDDGGEGLASAVSYTAPTSGITVTAVVRQFDTSLIGNDTGYVLNASVGATGAGQADFEFGISYIASPTDDRNFEFEILVENIGAAAAAADVGFYLSTDTVIDVNDVFVDFTSIGIVPAGDSTTVSGVVQWPTDLNGEYTFGLFVDDLNQVFESDETNNTTYFPPVFLGSGDQNCIDDFAEPDDTRLEARQFTLPLDRNYRTCTDSEDWLRFDASAGSTYTISTSRLLSNSDTALDLYDANGTLVATNDDVVGAESLNSAINYTAATSGALFLRMRQYENARGRDRGFFINIRENDTRPNLIAYLTLPSGPLTANTTIPATVYVTNAGLTDAPASRVRISAFQNAVGSLSRDGQTFIGLLELDVPAISAESFVQVSGNFTVPNFTGGLEFSAIADGDGAIDESVDSGNGSNFNQGNFVQRTVFGGTKFTALPSPEVAPVFATRSAPANTPQR